jgi:hypothetical protein
MDFLNTQEKRDRRLVHLPMGRFGEAIEQAKAALFCSSSSSCCVDYHSHLINLIIYRSGFG